MAQRALLVGSETFGLSGCNADVALMQTVLRSRRFDAIDVLIGANATREGILAGFKRLIAASAANDAAVVYYSGHGGRIPLPGWEARQAAGLDAFAQFIVPYDMAQTTAADFRGLLSVELSELQSRLTAKTRNVTTIMDCCHSGLMSRDASLIPKAVSREFPNDGAIKRLAEVEARADAPTADGNPDAVRVVACAPDQSAFEGPSQFRPGERHGFLTDALASLLLQLTGDSTVSWRTHAERLRMVISAAAPTQRPEVEGPSRRLPFTLREDARNGALPVRVEAGDGWLEGARLLGISPGDRYMLFDGSGHELGAATAEAPVGDRARLSADGDTSDWHTAVAAVPLRTSSLLPVSVGLPEPMRAQMLAAIEGSASLSVSETGQPTIGTVDFDGGLLVTDPARLPMHPGRLEANAEGVRRAIELLENLARAQRFRSLQPADDASRLAQQVDVKFTLHTGDEAQSAIAGSGERLFVRDRVSVTVRNLGETPLFFWLFDVGADATIEMVTNATPSGRLIAPGGQPGDTQIVGGVRGTALQWPSDLPADGGRLETFAVIVTDRVQDLSSLVTRRTARRELRAPTPLQAALDEAGTGVRNWPAESPAAASLRYRVEMCDVILQPGLRPRLDEPAFALDQRPDLSLRMLSPRGGAAPPEKAAVRLVALSVRKNRALLRATVRLDAMVITGDREGRTIATPLTQRFPGIADGDLLPMDNLLLYVGPVHEFLDIAIWVNRDDDKGASLADMFAEEVTRPAVKSALTVVGGLILAAPSVAVGVGAIVAVAELVRVGAHLVSTAVGKNIGLYRTSLLPYERFGVGRHPVDGMQEAQEIGFAYEVLEQP